jgi:hypothetical protein
MSLHGAVRRVAGVVALVLVAGLLSSVSDIVGAGPAEAQPTVVPFSYIGAQQTWMVPAGVTSIQVDAQGASGGDGGGAPYWPTGQQSGGFGGRE